MDTLKILLWILGVVLTIFPIAVMARVIVDGEKIDCRVWKITIVAWTFVGVIFILLNH